MKPMQLNGMSLLGLGASLLALSACGGTGGGSIPINSPSTVTPTPTPVPPPPVQPVNYDTPEYRRSSSATASGAISAWTLGFLGDGVTVAIIDSGIADQSAEFAGRISTASRDSSGQNRGIADSSGHGTAIAGVIGAARNNEQIIGIAPQVTLAVMKADSPGSCADSDGCRFTDSAMANGVDAAIAAGARAINISLGGSAASTTLRSAVSRATRAGIVIIVSAGNDAMASVDPLAVSLMAAAERRNIIVVGGNTAGNAIADFSNQAGAAQDVYITALAEQVRSFDHLGTPYLYSGTSFATPQVTAAVALLAQGFPALSGSQIVDLLFATATDAGAAGTDAVFGHGILNIARAFAPVGTTSLAGTALPVSLSANGNLGSAMGSGTGFASALGSVAIEDSYQRGYSLAIGQTLRPAAVQRLAAALSGERLHSAETSAAAGPFTVSMQVRSTSATGSAAQSAQAEQSHLGLAQRGLDAHAGARNPLRETMVALSAGRFTVAAASGPSASAILPGSAASGLLAADGLDADRDPARTDRRLVMAQAQFGALRLAAATGSGRTDLAPTLGLARVSHQSRTSLAAALPVGPLSLGARLTHLSESGAFLGTRLSAGFGLTGASSIFAGASADLALAPGFSLRAAATRGWHSPQLSGGLLSGASGIRSTGWSAALTTPAPAGRFSFHLAQPLALTAGRFLLADGAAPVAVAARERIAELGWAHQGAANMGVTLFHRQNPGHAKGPADQGAAVVLSRNF